MGVYFIQRYVSIRLKQIYRMFAEVGLGYLVILGLLGFVLLLALMEKLSKNQTMAWALLPAVCCSSWHFRRLDYAFLKHLSSHRPFLYLSEYLLLSFPFLCLIAYFQNWKTVVLCLIALLILAYLPTKKQESSVKVFDFNFIPIRFYEWRTGLRQGGVVLFVLYLGAILGMGFEGSLLLFSFIATLIIASFYDYCEPKEWINATHFVMNKLRNHVLLWTLFVAPLMLLYCIFHTETWYLAIAAWYFGAMTTAFAVVYKYSCWRPNRGRINNSVAVSIFIGLLLIIFTSPACIIAIIYYYRKSKNNPFLKCSSSKI
jgi:hypothetical protein